MLIYELRLCAPLQDVAGFLGVDAGLFYFDASYRPVPLEMQFVGVSERNILQAKNIMDEVCYEKVRLLSCTMSGMLPSVAYRYLDVTPFAECCRS